MNFPPGMHAIASVVFERMLFCLAEGAALAAVVRLVLHLIPEKTAQTRFLIWFSALVSIAVLPLLRLEWQRATLLPVPERFLVILPDSLATSIFLAWAILFVAGLMRIAAGAWQVHRLRWECAPMETEQMGPELTRLVQEFRRVRPVSVLISHDVHVPSAVGFLRPAIILPAWLAAEGAPEELKHVLLHEMAHLRRRDDWTNLLQRILKAALFFHPVVWWMEKELALNRELACDDAALSQSASPRAYAESLAHLAERGLLQRQIALAQAAVSHVRHLTLRVARILDPNRPASASMWKPAVPVVAALAVLCGFSVSWMPSLVKIEDGSVLSASVPLPGGNGLSADSQHPAGSTGVRAWSAVMAVRQNGGGQAPFVPAKLVQRYDQPPAASRNVDRKSRDRKDYSSSPIMSGRHKAASRDAAVAYGLKSNRAEEQGRFVLVVATRQTVIVGPAGWQVSISEVSFLAPVKQIPTVAPGKT